MNIYDMIQEWKKGCSDCDNPIQCQECTSVLIKAIENSVKPEVTYIGNAALNPDHILTQAKGCYRKVIVIGVDFSNNIDTRASTNMNSQDVLWCIEKFKHFTLMDMEYGED